MSATDSPASVPRSEDVFRHLDDLRTRTFEGAEKWEDRVARFERAVGLLDPLVQRILAETDRSFLDEGGRTTRHDETDRDGGRWARWELSWPDQRQMASRRGGGPIPPLQVVLAFTRNNQHPHLCGSDAGSWPCQVADEADAGRQEPILRAIVEVELHQRIFEGGWHVIPAYARRHPGD